ncbi:MAG: response regulator transcription factor [Sandaracinus sp.]|nr:response regulator transcription factor [Sandaracinus sp.]
MARLLVIEDDQRLGEALCSELRGAGWTVSWARDAHTARQRVTKGWDAILLDLGLPDGSGLDVLKELRGGGSRVPVLVLTARVRGPDKVKALDLGADDYVTKPFWTDEVLARLRAVVRRSEGQAPPTARTLRVGGCVLNLDAQRLTRGDRVIALTPTEWAILAYLAERLDRPVRRGQLSDAVLQVEDAHESALQAHVSRLRRKLGPDAEHLQTVWGIGYRLTPGEGS